MINYYTISNYDDYDTSTTSTFTFTFSTSDNGYICYDNYGRIVSMNGLNKTRPFLSASIVSETSLVLTTEERIEEYIMDNYDKSIIQEYGLYIYQVIEDKAYDFASEVIEEARKEYTVLAEDEIVEAIVNEINFDSLYQLIEDILYAPITMEEKLADIGMSERDFL